MHPRHPTPARRRQRGFSFFEVLIAALILGVGVLGFAGLQVRALDSTNIAYFRSQATTLATDMAERIRLYNEGSITYGGPPGVFPNLTRGPAVWSNVGTFPYSDYLRDVKPAYWTAALPAGAPYDSSWNGKTCYNSALTKTCDTGANTTKETDLVSRDILELRYLTQTLLPGGNMTVRRCDTTTNVIGNVCVYVGWQGIDSNTDAQCKIGQLNDRCVVVQVYF